MRKSLYSNFTLLSLSLLLYACGGGSGSEGTKLSWTPPATRSDGSYLAFESIAGYKIYYGSDESELELLVEIADRSTNSTSIPSSNEGKYYYGVTVYNAYNLESELSNLVRK
jgi:hypothetical protein